MNRWIWLTTAIIAVGSTATCQSNSRQTAAQVEQSSGSAELNRKEANRMTLPPPKDVRAKQEGHSVVVEWVPSAQKRVVEYKVFRVEESGGKMTEVGRTKATSFVVDKVEGKSAFSVAAVDYRGNEGEASAPVKPQKSAAAK